MKTELLDSVQALQALELYNPAKGTKPNTRYLLNLVKRGLLPRIELGKRTFRYDINDCERLLNKVKHEGLQLI